MKKIIELRKIFYLLTIVLIIAGIVVISTIGFAFSRQYTDLKEVQVYVGKDIELSDMESILEEAELKNSTINYVQGYTTAVVVRAVDISEEQLKIIEEKVIEKYELEENGIPGGVEIENFPAVDVGDLLSRYIPAIVITTLIALVWYFIRYRKINIFLASGILILSEVLTIALFLSLIALTRMPVSFAIQAGFVISVVLAIIANTYLNEKLLESVGANAKSKKGNETISKYKVTDVLKESFSAIKKAVLPFVIVMVVIAIVSIILGTPELIYLALLLMFAVLTPVFVIKCNIIPLWYDLSKKE